VKPILVPAPPRSAYNHNRRVSDLLLSQLKHFQHVELKHGRLEIPSAIARDVYTEAGAARYIAAVTRALRGTASAQPADVATVAGSVTANETSTPVPVVALPPAARKIASPPKKSSSKKTASKRLTAKKLEGKK
jgi:hypothetical protein